MYCKMLKNNYEPLEDLFHVLVIHLDYCFDFRMIQMILQ